MSEVGWIGQNCRSQSNKSPYSVRKPLIIFAKKLHRRYLTSCKYASNTTTKLALETKQNKNKYNKFKKFQINVKR